MYYLGYILGWLQGTIEVKHNDGLWSVDKLYHELMSTKYDEGWCNGYDKAQGEPKQ